MKIPGFYFWGIFSISRSWNPFLFKTTVFSLTFLVFFYIRNCCPTIHQLNPLKHSKTSQGELHYFHLVCNGKWVYNRLPYKKTSQHVFFWAPNLNIPILWNQILQHLQRISKNTEGIPHKSRITPRPFFGQCGLAASPFRLCWTLRMCLEEEYIYIIFLICYNGNMNQYDTYVLYVIILSYCHVIIRYKNMVQELM